MYNPKEKENKDITFSFRKIEITLALGCEYNPEISKQRNISPFLLTTPYLKYDNNWYHIKDSWKWNKLTHIKDYLKENVYSEEQFLEKLIKLTV